ncbi:MAG: hypothetical protein ACRECO_20665 [Xanthobacteraceae bacterium]
MSELGNAQQSARAKINAALPCLDVGAVAQGCTLSRPPTDRCVARNHLYCPSRSRDHGKAGDRRPGYAAIT